MTEFETEPSHEAAEEWLNENMSWPQYYVSGEDVDEESFVPAYYRVEGPNGPVSYVNPNTGPFATTMHDLAMEARANSFHVCNKEDTPWTEVLEE